MTMWLIYRRHVKSFLCAVVAIVVACHWATGAVWGDQPTIPLLQDVGIEQRLGQTIPGDIVLQDEGGRSVHVRDLRRGKPVILALVYYQCPMLCTLVLNDLLSTVKTIPQTVGDEYDVWTVSFDPKETAALAAKKKAEYLHSYNRVKQAGTVAEGGWRFLTGDAANIRSLTTAVGFKYKWDGATQQYVHPAGIVILTPEARIASYYFGIDFDPTDIRLSLVEASANKIATPTERMLLFCYHYDPATGKYGLAVANTLRAAAGLTLLVLGSLTWGLWRYDRRRTKQLLRAYAEAVWGDVVSTFELAPESASQMAGSWDWLFLFVLALTTFFAVLIAALILVFVVKYRRRHPKEIGVDTGEHYWLEWTWSGVPMAILIFVFIWSATLFVRMSQPPADALEIHVVGKQWMWKIQQPSGRKEIDELHIPLGRPIKLEMTSQDVIHSFFVPAFRIKQDVVPGRYSYEWFTADKLGEYHLFCSQYCGTSHAAMIGTVYVMEPRDYAKWAASAAMEDRPEAAGEHLFTQYGCINCHGSQAPSLAGIYGHSESLSDGSHVLVDDGYLRESIINSRAKMVAGYPPIMPSYQGQLSEEQLNQLIAYIKSLRAAKAGGEQ